MVQLGETGGHLAAARTRSRDDYQGAGGLNVIVLAVAFVADNEGHIAGVAFDTVMAVYFDVTVLQLGFELVGAALAAVLGDDNASHIEALVPELLNQTEYILVVSDAQVMADLVLFDVSRIDGNEDFGLVSHLKEHTKLAVRCKAGQDPGGVVVVKKLSSEFQIQLVSEFPNTLFDVF